MMIEKTTAPHLTANYHTHTTRCRHASGSDREYLETAIRAGIKILGFADHAPLVNDIGFVSHMRMYTELAEDYACTLAALKKEYAGDIDIYIGYELEYYPQFFDMTVEYLCRFPVDYFIIGQHYIENETSYRHAGIKVAEEWYLRAYVDQIVAGLETGLFSCVAHPDLMDFMGADDVYDRHMTRLCETAKRLSVPLEFNIPRRFAFWHEPVMHFWDIARAVGNDVILGCDAHEPGMLCEADSYRESLEILAGHGIVPMETMPLAKPHFPYRTHP